MSFFRPKSVTDTQALAVVTKKTEELTASMQQATIAMRQAMSEKPAWVADLIENLANLNDNANLAAIINRELARNNERFEALQRFVETGRSCPDCRKTQERMIDELVEIVDEIGNQQVDQKIGETYASRAHAWAAGRNFAQCAVKEMIRKMKLAGGVISGDLQTYKPKLSREENYAKVPSMGDAGKDYVK